jgi:predicted enzyme related to lactoylglutathione lyase
MTHPQTAPKPDLKDQIGRSVWFDIPVVNLADAMSFYSGLLGWEYSQMEDSSLQDYVMIQVRGKLIGGLNRVASLPKQKGINGPILYFTVENLGASITRAKELGAVIIEKPVNLGKNRGSYQWIRDREGNLVGLWGPQ